MHTVHVQLRIAVISYNVGLLVVVIKIKTMFVKFTNNLIGGFDMINCSF